MMTVTIAFRSSWEGLRASEVAGWPSKRDEENKKLKNIHNPLMCCYIIGSRSPTYRAAAQKSNNMNLMAYGRNTEQVVPTEFYIWNFSLIMRRGGGGKGGGNGGGMIKR